MGSVQSEVKCPQCGNPEAFEDYDYKRGIEFFLCGCCGRHEYRSPEERRIRKGAGAYCVRRANGVGQTGAVPRHNMRNFVSSLHRIAKRPTVRAVVYTAWVRGRWTPFFIKQPQKDRSRRTKPLKAGFLDVCALAR